MSSEVTLRQGHVLSGSLLREPIHVEIVRLDKQDTWISSLASHPSKQFCWITLVSHYIFNVITTDTAPPDDGDGRLLQKAPSLRKEGLR